MSYCPGFYLDKVRGLHLYLSSNRWRGVQVPSKLVGEMGTKHQWEQAGAHPGCWKGTETFIVPGGLRRSHLGPSCVKASGVLGRLGKLCRYPHAHSL